MSAGETNRPTPKTEDYGCVLRVDLVDGNGLCIQMYIQKDSQEVLK